MKSAEFFHVHWHQRQGGLEEEEPERDPWRRSLAVLLLQKHFGSLPQVVIQSLAFLGSSWLGPHPSRQEPMAPHHAGAG